jgi:hypothetical protein
MVEDYNSKNEMPVGSYNFSKLFMLAVGASKTLAFYIMPHFSFYLSITAPQLQQQ